MYSTKEKPPFTMLLTTVPGPNRKKTPAIYQYRMVYRNPTPEPGCSIVWEVVGGRSEYQVAVEKKTDGGIAWHCTCPDAVYRGEIEKNHICKHVHALLDCALPAAA